MKVKFASEWLRVSCSKVKFASEWLRVSCSFPSTLSKFMMRCLSCSFPMLRLLFIQTSSPSYHNAGEATFGFALPTAASQAPERRAALANCRWRCLGKKLPASRMKNLQKKE
jgi:hypothetical protein